MSTRQKLGIAMVVVLVCGSVSLGAVLKVPQDHKTIPAAVAAANPGDTILIARGTYTVDSLDVPKTLVLASNYIDSKNDDDIDKTIIKAAAKAGKQWFDIRPNAKNTKLIGLTILGSRNHSLAIRNSYTEVRHCRFIGGRDQLSFEGGGLVSHCYFEGSRDEPIDADKSLSWTVEYCTFKGSGQDGLEIRLHPKEGPLTTHIVRYNTFLGNRGACIQLVDYDGDSHREFRVYGNIFKNAVNMGIDCTLDSSDGNMNGSPMVERAIIFNNTFDGCRNGITMAPGVVVLNNIFTNTGKKGILKGKYVKQGDSSIVDHCLFFRNGSDYDDGLNIGNRILTFDPQYSDTTSYKLSPGSPAIDKGIATYEWKGTKVLDIPKKQYSGKAPDLGAKEMGDDGVKFINQASQKKNPFFMYLAFNVPHDSRQSPKEYVDRQPLDEVEVPENFLPEYPYKDGMGCSKKLRDEKLGPFPRTEYAVKVHRQEYYAIITHMDVQVGRMLSPPIKQRVSG